jgi:diaminopimelate decarboxylase
MIPDATLAELAAVHGTPLYVYDLDAVARRVRALRAAVPEAALRYAVKANPSGALLARLAALGVGAEAITVGEVARALRAGVSAGDVLVGGPGQGPDLRALARRVAVGHVSLDGAGQWRAWRDAPPAGTRFLVRVNPGFDPRTHEHLATGAAGSKFGLPLPEAEALAARLDGEGRLAGFHVHAGSMIRDPEVHREILRRVAPLYRRFPAARTFDLGGGFAVPDFDLDALAATVRPWIHERGLELVLEPGRWLVAEAGVLLTRVLWRKDDAPGHWICDAGMAQLLRPALYGAEHPIRVVAGGDTEIASGDVDGPLCENADRLGRDRRLAAGEGDLLAIGQAGAYGMAMASNYASDLRPAEVVLEDGRARLTRLRESPEDLWRLEAAAEAPEPAI